MNLIKNILLKIGTGFLYGSGFSIAIVAIASISLTHFSSTSEYPENKIERDNKIINSDRDNTYKKYDETAKLVADVTKERITENEFTLIGVLKNKGESNWSSINLKAEIYNENGEFIEECSEYISEKSTPGSLINFKLSCGSCSKLNLEEYHSYKLSITNAYFNMN